MIDEAASTTPAADTAVMVNDEAANNEQRLLVHLEQPSGGIDYDVMLPVDHLAEVAFGGNSNQFLFSTRYTPVTEDFDYTGGSCATWATKPATDAAKQWDSDPHGDAAHPFVITDTLDLHVQDLSMWGKDVGPSWETITVYGVEISIFNVTGTGGGSYDITSTLSTNKGFAIG